MSDKTEYENFDRMMQKLIKVPHSKIKAKLEAEKEERNIKKGKRDRDSQSQQ